MGNLYSESLVKGSTSAEVLANLFVLKDLWTCRLGFIVSSIKFSEGFIGQGSQWGWKIAVSNFLQGTTHLSPFYLHTDTTAGHMGIVSLMASVLFGMSKSRWTITNAVDCVRLLHSRDLRRENFCLRSELQC